VVCAGLTAEGFLRLATVYQGFEPANVLRLEIGLSEKSYSSNAQIIGFYDRLLEQAAALPGVRAAVLVRNSPASNVDNESTYFTIEGRPALQINDAASADLQISSTHYFDALRIRLLAGRGFSQADGPNTAHVVLISRSLAARFWPGEGAVGRRIKLGGANSTEPWMTVVGIVEDVRQNWWNPVARPTIYEPFLQAPRRGMVFLLRASQNPTSYVSNVRD